MSGYGRKGGWGLWLDGKKVWEHKADAHLMREDFEHGEANIIFVRRDVCVDGTQLGLMV